MESIVGEAVRRGSVQALKGVKVCLLTSAHPPLDDRIFYKEGHTLVKLGADVTLVCPEPAKPVSIPDLGIAVRYFRRPTRAGGRLLAIPRLAKMAKSVGADVIHCHEPDALVASSMARKGTAARIIYDSHEMWGAVAAGRAPRAFESAVGETFKVFEQRWVRRADGAIGASWSISRWLGSILGEPRVRTILNVPRADLFAPTTTRQWTDKTIVVHDGTLNFDRGLKVMAEAIRRVRERHPVVLRIVGDVFGEERDWLNRFVQENSLSGVIERTGWLPYDKVGAALAVGHIGLIALQKTPNNIVTSSNKVFNYLLYGIPFIGPSWRLAKVKLVEEEKCGLLADSSSVESYAGAIIRMIENRAETMRMAQRASDASRAKYRWEHMEPVLLAAYRDSLRKGIAHAAA